MLNYQVFETNAYNDNATTLVQSNRMVAQTFTPGASHTLTAISVKLIGVSGGYTTATAAIYSVDGDGAPTGSALTSHLITPGDMPAVNPDWVDVVFDSSIHVISGVKYALVLSYPGGGEYGWRYNENGTYTAGTSWTSADGVTWEEYTDGDLLFQEFGIAIQINNCTKVQLVPSGFGQYDQLQPCSKGNVSELPNWQCVNDPVDSPTEENDYVCYNIFDNVGFLTGSDEGVSGVLSGTSARWKTGPSMNGLWGDGTDFENEITIGDLLKSPNDNAWYPYNWKRIAEVASIQGAEALTFKYMKSGELYQHPTEMWFFTPQRGDMVNSKYVPPDGGHYPYRLPMKSLTGTWHVVSGSKRVYADGDGNAIEELISPCAVAAGPKYTMSLGVEYVLNDNEFYVYDAPDYSAHSDEFIYCTFSQVDDLTDEDTATMWSKKTKKDSYTLKTTQMKGTIIKVDIVFRCALTDSERLTQAMIATYDSSDEDKQRSVAHVESFYDGPSDSDHLCATLTDGTGVCTGSPISITWHAATGFPYYEEYDIDVTTAGTFSIHVEDGKYVNVTRYIPGGPTISGGGIIGGPADVTFAVHDVGKIRINASGYAHQEYTDAEIAIATNSMIESVMTKYQRVVFAPGTWKQYKAEICAGDYIHIGTNDLILDGPHAIGYIDAEDCDGSHDEVQWNDRLDNYNKTVLGNNVTPGYVLEDYVVAGRNMGSLSDSTATAQPFVRLNGVEVYGTEETLHPPQPMGYGRLIYPDFQFSTYRQTLSRPGGGCWTLDDVNTLEAGIVLGNVTNPNNTGTSIVYGYEAINKPCCTQIYAEVYFIPSNTEIVTEGLTQYAFKVFKNGEDEWNFPAFNNGMNLYTHKIYTNVLSLYVARGKQTIRGAVSRIIRRRRTSSVVGRGRTSGHITE